MTNEWMNPVGDHGTVSCPGSLFAFSSLPRKRTSAKIMLWMVELLKKNWVEGVGGGGGGRDSTPTRDPRWAMGFRPTHTLHRKNVHVCFSFFCWQKSENREKKLLARQMVKLQPLEGRKTIFLSSFTTLLHLPKFRENTLKVSYSRALFGEQRR
jgi:hypothetical protein